MRKYFEGIKRRVAAVVCASLILGMCPSTVIEGAVSRKYRAATSNDAWKDSTQSTPEEDEDFDADSNPEDEYTGPGVSSTSTPSFYEIATVAMATRSTSKYDQFVVPSLTPENVTVNLFDYWVEAQGASDTGIPNAMNASVLKERIFNDHSINLITGTDIPIPHAFVFAGIDRAKPPAFGVRKESDSNGETNNNQGFAVSYNTYLRDNFKDGTYHSYPTQNILNRKLGEDGYPQLNLTTEQVKDSFNYMRNSSVTSNCYNYDDIDPKESLAYLFDPDFEGNQEGRRAYPNVKGLFQINEDGSYYYDSKKNAAIFDKKDTIKLLSKPAYKVNQGQFFPFNTAEQLFDVATNSSTNKQELRIKSLPTDKDPTNHYFGLTMQVDFQQPVDGKLTSGFGSKPMTFTYSGDDDIWIFIDGVLVADMGGIHDAAEVSINFADGSIEYSDPFKTASLDRINHNVIQDTTLREQFAAAYGDDKEAYVNMFNGNTFKDWTQHKLQVYYLERGHFDSNLMLTFNLMKPQAGEILKVDQAGKPLQGVEFKLYQGNKTADGEYDPESIKGNEPIATLRTDEEGKASFVSSDNETLSFSGDWYYVLKETATPKGYISNGDIILKYNDNTHLFKVENTWSTGAVAGFTAEISQAGALKYSAPVNGTATVSEADGHKGLILAVPLYNEDRNGANANKEKWHPMYGSVMEGFNLVRFTGNYTDEKMRETILEAAMRQAVESDSNDWYLGYNQENGRYEGSLSDLPGLADSYVTNNAQTGYLTIAYYLLENDEFSEDDKAEEKYNKLIDSIKKGTSEETNQSILDFVSENKDKLRLLDITGFNRHYFIKLYIPNQARTLQVYKENEEGKPLQGAEFTLFYDPECADEAVSGVTGEDGLLDFSVENEKDENDPEFDTSKVHFALSAKRSADGNLETGPLSYYLKETKAPAGYEPNDSVIEVLVTTDSLYVNAGSANNGVSVAKGVGYLVKTVARYAASEKIDVTLRDVIARKYVLDANKRPDGDGIRFGEKPWEATGSQLKLHYHLNSNTGQGNMGYDYGVHEKDTEPYFVSNTGWLGYDVIQNLDAHKKPGDEYFGDEHEKMDLGTQDLSHLLSGSITVMVTDKRIGPGELLIKKVDPQGKELADAEFELEFFSKDAYEKLKKDGKNLALSELATGSEAIKKYLEELKLHMEFTSYKKLVTNKDGIATLSELPEGIYRLRETKAPDGMKLDTEPIYFKISGSDVVDNKVRVELTITNQYGSLMPKTGGPGTTKFYMYGLLLIGAALAIEKERRKGGKGAVHICRNSLRKANRVRRRK